MSLLVASLYLLCLAFLFGSAVYVYSRDPFSRLNTCFALLALALLSWVGTLFLFGVATEERTLLLLGRANFAAAALAAPAVYLFVSALAKRYPKKTVGLWLVTAAFMALSLFTPWIDSAEMLVEGEHVTTYGVLFLPYVLHILAFLIVALWIAFQTDTRLPSQTRLQLRLLGVGILATALISVITNAFLPYLYGDFRFIHAGTLSTIAFLISVAYTASVHRLFNVRILIRKTLIFSVLITFALELYQLTVEFLARLLPLDDPTQRHLAAAAIALILNAVTQQALKEWLERLVDKWLSRKQRHPASRQ